MHIIQLLAAAAMPCPATAYFLLLSFIAGILVSFTPCVYPMIPITAGILHSQESQSILRNFFSSIAYIFGIALIYASLGYISATSAIVFGKWLANPWFIGFMVAIFFYFAGSMFGWYHLYIPSFMQRSNQLNAPGSLLSSFIYGLVSGTVASPCLTPALAVLLGIVAKHCNPFVGFLALFFFSLGMGILLMLIGTFSSSFTLLPQAGEWMVYFERALGFLIVATCIYFVQPFFSDAVVFDGFGSIAGIATIYYFFHARTSWVALTFGIISLLTTMKLIYYLVRI